MNDQVTVLNDKFNSSTGEQVDGITIIVDGMLKQVMDIIIDQSDEFNSYESLVVESLFKGLNEIRKNK